jgi:DNA (cytosine-5)-methyltransferase 1
VFNDGESVESWEARRQRNLAKFQNGNGHGTPLAIAVKLLPTPTAWLGRRPSQSIGDPERWTNPDRSNELSDFIAYLSGDTWGKYAPAIERHEQVTGHPAPAPTENGRLSPAFVEWMMMLPQGWVTDIDISRTAQLRCLGNAIVPPCAAAAWGELKEEV